MTKRAAFLTAVVCLLLASAVSPCPAQRRSGAVHVRGYTRKDGTYVAPHYRSAPNGTTSDNWSTKGNVNPYTGAPGTREPDDGSSYNGSASTNSSTTWAIPTATTADEQLRIDAARRLHDLGWTGDWRLYTRDELIQIESQMQAGASATNAGTVAPVVVSEDEAKRIAAAVRIHDLGWELSWYDYSLVQLLDFESRIRRAQSIGHLGLERDWREYTLAQLVGIETAMKKR